MTYAHTISPENTPIAAPGTVRWVVTLTNPTGAPVSGSIAVPLVVGATRGTVLCFPSTGVTGATGGPGWTGDATVTVPADGGVVWLVPDTVAAHTVGTLTANAIFDGASVRVATCEIAAAIPCPPEIPPVVDVLPATLATVCCSYAGATDTDAVPEIVIRNGNLPLANFRVRVWQNPQGLPCPGSSIDAFRYWQRIGPCSELVVAPGRALPPWSVLTLDGRDRRAVITRDRTPNVIVQALGGGAGNAPGEWGFQETVPAAQILSAPGGQRWEWPVIGCFGVCVCVMLDAATTDLPNTLVTVRFHPRSLS
jgi:hypothetical protein